jgi:hypothetical protein
MYYLLPDRRKAMINNGLGRIGLIGLVGLVRDPNPLRKVSHSLPCGFSVIVSGHTMPV